MKLTKNWQSELKEYWNIETIQYLNSFIDKSILTTNCSKTKSGIQRGIPKDFYVSKRNLKFYSFCNNHNLSYGIISDKYGIVFEDETIEHYDTHPSNITIENKKKLGKIIRGKIDKDIIFYNPSPLMSKPYFEILYYSDLKVYFTTRLQFNFTRSLI